MVPSERTVTIAVGHGKRAARHIDAWLRGVEFATAAKHPVATFQSLNTWYYADAPKKLGPGKRFAIDYDYCKGCGICAVECPAGAIAMVPETI